MLLIESAYILLHRHRCNRFKVAAGYAAFYGAVGEVAFDTETRQLCRTYSLPALDDKEKAKQTAKALAMFKSLDPKVSTELNIPACKDIR
jgi:hypothetical protein